MKIILTGEGVTDILHRGISPKAVAIPGARRRYGIYLDRLDPAILQRMVTRGYVSDIEITICAARNSRPILMDTVRFIALAQLYRQFSLVTYDELMKSSIIRRWNRSNPKSSIDFRTQMNRSLIQQYLHRRSEEVRGLKAKILEEIDGRDDIEASALGWSLLDHVNPFLWVALIIHRESTGYDDLVRSVRQSLSSYVEKSSVAAYVSLMVLELIVFLQPGLFRPQELSANAAKLSMHINRSPLTSGDRARLEIVVADGTKSRDSIRDAVLTGANTVTNGKSIRYLYRKSARGSPNTTLGLYYLSFLKDSCKQMGIGFDSFVRQGAQDGTEIGLSLLF